MTTTSALLLTATFAACGLWATDWAQRMVPAVANMDLLSRRKVLNHALLGAAIGSLTSLSFGPFGSDEYVLGVLTAVVWTVTGGMLVACARAAARPQALAKTLLRLDMQAHELSAPYAELMRDPVAMQNYLDQTYGRGVVNAREHLREIRAKHGRKAFEPTVEALAEQHAANERLREELQLTKKEYADLHRRTTMH